PVEAIALAPATRLMAVAVGEDILVHNFETKRSVTNVGLGVRVASVAFSPDGTRMAATSHGKRLAVYETENFQTTASSLDYGAHIAFTPRGTHLLVVRDERFIDLLDARTLHKVRRYEGHTNRVRHLEVPPEAGVFYSQGDDGVLRQWPLPEEVLAAAPPPKNIDPQAGSAPKALGQWKIDLNCTAIAFTPNPERLVLGGAFLELRDLTMTKAIRSFRPFKAGTVRGAVAVTKDGKKLFANTMDDPVTYCYDLESGEELGRLEGHTRGAEIALTPDEKY